MLLFTNSIVLLCIIFFIGNSNGLLNGDDVGGVKLTPRKKGVIVTGQDKYKFMAHLYISGKHKEHPDRQSMSSACGGVIISEKAVLTAGHCLDDFTDLIVQVQAGIVHLIFEEVAGQTRNMNYFVTHPGYTKECAMANDLIIRCLSDLAIVFVERQFVFGNKIGKAILNVALKNGPPHLTEGLVLGWGNQENRMLQSIKMRVIQRDQCQKINNDLFIADDVFCVLSDTRRQATCSGDSGGPFIVGNVVYGILSMGFGKIFGNIVATCNSDRPAIFTNIADYLDWIEEEIELSNRKIQKSKHKILSHSHNNESNDIPPVKISKKN